MMHGPCGTSNPNSPCMIDGTCSKRFPKEFVETTFTGTDGYPHYRRRNDGKHIIKNGIHLDKRYVVPYNPYLSKKYNTHINVEICSSSKCCKYLNKYVYKTLTWHLLQCSQNNLEHLEKVSQMRSQNF